MQPDLFKRVVGLLFLVVLGVLLYTLDFRIFAYIVFILAYIVFILAIGALPLYKEKTVAEQDPSSSATVPVLQGQVLINGTNTPVLVLDNTFIDKVKSSERGKNPDTVFKKLPAKKFQLLK